MHYSNYGRQHQNPGQNDHAGQSGQRYYGQQPGGNFAGQQSGGHGFAGQQQPEAAALHRFWSNSDGVSEDSPGPRREKT